MRPVLSIAVGVALVALAAQAQEATMPRVERPPAEQAIEEDAIALLRSMGEHLQHLERFSISANTEAEIVLDNEQKLLIPGHNQYWVERPDRLRVDMSTDTLERSFIYDGKSIVFVAPDAGFYGEVEAPATIRDALIFAASRLNIVIPLADFFDWGTEDHDPVDELDEAFIVGDSMIDGQPATHVATRLEQQDLEIWISQGSDPLPLQYSIVEKQDPALPRFTVALTWNETAPADETRFAFQPGSEMRRIELRPQEGQAQ